MSGQVLRIPKGFHHLEDAARNKFTFRYRARAPHPPQAWVAPKNRVERWNVVPGDKVRLTVGKGQEKYLDSSAGAAGGWKVYTVHSVDQARNRVFLEGLNNKKANSIRPKPENFDELSKEEQQHWNDQRNYTAARRPVQYSNVQLCLEEKGPNSVFATRIATSSPWYDKATRRWHWTRYAAQVNRASTLAVDPARDQITIPWPHYPAPKPVDPSTIDTLEKDASEVTLALGPASTIPPELVPNSMRAPPTKEHAHSNAYIFNPEARAHETLQAAMPLYLGEELGPRFARYKKAKGWSARRELEAAARAEHVAEKLNKWEAGGRDQGIKEILALENIRLEDVSIRGRTRQEIRDTAGVEFDEAVETEKAAATAARAAGKVYDYQMGVYLEGPKGYKAQLKADRRKRRHERKLENLRNLKLQDEKNQVVPEDVRAY